ncbi:unnamed protein product [Arctia plantaginis]|uniref:Uncharacterized protein n=1 Tax=Arctia plantaginis TaxID=874455 RepID=A0A8S0ZZZ3_ARCPL|nr:unnamed protein product [Arctia plantaginis]
MNLIDVTATITFRTKIAIPSNSLSRCYRIPSILQVKAPPPSITQRKLKYHRVAPPPPVTTSSQKATSSQAHNTLTPRPSRPAPPPPNTKPLKSYHRAAPPPPMYASPLKKDSRKKSHCTTTSPKPNRPAPPPPVTVPPRYHRAAPPPPVTAPPRRRRYRNAPTLSVTAQSLRHHGSNNTPPPTYHRTPAPGVKKQRRSRITPSRFLNTKRACITTASSSNSTVTLPPSHNNHPLSTQRYKCSIPRPKIATTVSPSNASCIRHRVMIHHSDETQSTQQSHIYIAQDHQYTSAKPPLSIPVRKVNKKFNKK